MPASVIRFRNARFRGVLEVLEVFPAWWRAHSALEMTDFEVPRGGVLDVFAACWRAHSAFEMIDLGVPRGGVLEVFPACRRAYSALEMIDFGSRAEVFWSFARRAGARILFERTVGVLSCTVGALSAQRGGRGGGARAARPMGGAAGAKKLAVREEPAGAAGRPWGKGRGSWRRWKRCSDPG